MKKIIFGIFAHPDDEAFGPSGTLVQEVRSGTELHLFTLTNGDAGINIDNHTDLGSIRLKEWHKAARLIGASSTNHLGYKDGHLSNSNMIEISKQLVTYIQEKLKGTPSDIEVEFMTFDLNGLTGHIDHIVAARAVCWAFYNLQANDTRLKRIRLYCLTKSEVPRFNIDWIYMEQGRMTQEIDETIDARAYRNEILEIMQAHHTQRQDAATHILNRGDNLGLDHFLIKT